MYLSIIRRRHGLLSAFMASLALAFLASPASAALSERGGTGVWELQSAESHRPARLELGFFTAYQRLGLRDSADTQLNGSLVGANAVFGLPGGFEVSGMLPIYNYYESQGGGATPFDDLDPQLGDVTARLRWTGPLFGQGFRWGVEGEALLATGTDDAVAYPGRAQTRPFTRDANDYTGRAMLTWDGLRAGKRIPLRFHANGAYTLQGDETRTNIDHTPLPLQIASGTRNRDNDVLTLGGAVEFDLPRFTLFGEVLSNQLVNARGEVKGKENRTVVTPGLRFWLPGGISIGGAYSFSIAEDDASTTFDPGTAFPDNEWRAAVSLGTVYRGKQAKDEDAFAVTEEPVLPETVDAAGQPVAPTTEQLAAAKKQKEDAAILARRNVQETPKPATADTMMATEKPVAPEAEKVAPAATPAAPAPKPAAPAVAAPVAEAPAPKPEKPAAKPAAPVAPAAPAAPSIGNPLPAPGVVRGTGAMLDSDGDGIPDARDMCPLVPEDWDGFQDLDGCPDLDNDQDGIPDIRDQCPNDPETYNGYYDFDGCPDDPNPGRPMSSATGVRGATPPAQSLGGAPPDTGSRSPTARPALARGAVGSPTAPAVPQGPAADTVKAMTSPAPAVVRVVDNARVDSLSRALEAERQRARMFESQLDRADTANMSLAAERQRAEMLAAQLNQTEAERRVLLNRALAARSSGASDSALATLSTDELRQMILADRARQADLVARLEAMQLRQDAMVDRNSLPVATRGPDPVSHTTVISPGESSADLQGRIAMMEARLATLQAARAAEQVVGNAASAQPVQRETLYTQVPGSPNPEVLARLSELQTAVQTLNERQAEAETPAAPAGPSPSEALDLLLPIGQTRVFPELQFATASTSLTAESWQALQSFSQVLRAVPDAHVRVIGHTDDRGLKAANQQLSEARARAVAEALVAQGVQSSQVGAEGRGESQPITTNATAEGRQMNRRVEIMRVR